MENSILKVKFFSVKVDLMKDGFNLTSAAH